MLPNLNSFQYSNKEKADRDAVLDVAACLELLQ